MRFVKIPRAHGKVTSKSICQDENRIVGAHIPVYCDSIKALGNCLTQCGPERASFDICIGGEKAKHRSVEACLRRAAACLAHARLNHACSFANSSQANCLAAQLELKGH